MIPLRSTILTLVLVLGGAILMAVLNLGTAESSALHVPTYAVSLAGKYLSFAMLALALDLVWGFAGILSLGHAAFFALGGYAMGMYLMRQIGPRDVAKFLGGMGACGLETRCCSKFLTEFSPISIKMAKEQGISLTPTEITGMCGRLRCCLIYEYEQYVAARKELPKRGKRVVTPDGEGKVLDTYPLRNVVQVELDPRVVEHTEHHDRPERPERFERPERPIVREYERDLLEPWDELEALRRKAGEPCDKHDGGNCDCGKNEKKTAPKK